MRRRRKQNKIVAILVAALLVGALTAWVTKGDAKKPNYAPGTYLAASDGIGAVLVSVTVDHNSILDIELDVSQESPDRGGEAAKVLRDRILHNQSVKVDAISGATTTSQAVLEAVERALRKAELAAVEEMKNEKIASLTSNVEELQSQVDSLTKDYEALLKVQSEQEEENELLRQENYSKKFENDTLRKENEELSKSNESLLQFMEESTQATTAAQTEEKTTKDKDKSTKTKAAKETKAEEKTTEAEQTTKKKEEKAEKETASKDKAKEVETEEKSEETSNDLVSMSPVEMSPKEETKAKEYFNSPSFQYAYVGTNVIMSVQQGLANLGYDTMVDGIYGPGTEGDLMAYQISRGLVSDGDVNAQTLKMLLGVEAPGSGEQGKKVSSNASMETANVLAFTYEDKGYWENGYTVDVTALNQQSVSLKKVSLDCVWYNLAGEKVTDSQVELEETLKSGASKTVSLVLEDYDLSGQVASMGVGGYSYTLAKPDENGYSTYHVNLLTGEVIGS